MSWGDKCRGKSESFLRVRNQEPGILVVDLDKQNAKNQVPSSLIPEVNQKSFLQRHQIYLVRSTKAAS